MQQRLSDYQERLGLAPKDHTIAMLVEQHRRIGNLAEAERNPAFQQNVLATVSQSQLRNMEFQRNYRASAIALRDELLKRLPERKPEMLPALDYGMLAGVSPVGHVADYLERLAKLLP
jgi:hypothetical protein